MRVDPSIALQIRRQTERKNDEQSKIKEYKKKITEINNIVKQTNKDIKDVSDYKRILSSQKKQEHPYFQGNVYNKQYLNHLTKSIKACDTLTSCLNTNVKKLKDKMREYEWEIAKCSMKIISINETIGVLNAAKYIYD